MESETEFVDEPNQNPKRDEDENDNNKDNVNGQGVSKRKGLALPSETVEQISSAHFKKEKTKFSSDALEMTTEMLQIYIMEIAYRAAEEAAADGKEEVGMEHLKRIMEIDKNDIIYLKLGGTLAFHPLELSKVLIQLGHEPIAPRNTKTLLGKPALAYPSVFQYCGHIRRRDGFLGLWRGVSPRLINVAIQHFAEKKFNELYPPEETKEEDEDELTLEQKQEKVLRETLRSIACKLTCVVITQPLHVMALRAIAEFVGNEEKYSGGLTLGLYNGAVNILQENGLLGFWSGLIPRALGEVGVIAVTAGLSFLVNEFMVKDKDMKQYTNHVTNFLAGSLFYPLQVSSACMAVSRSGLAAGYPPMMPFYTSWWDCLKRLKAEGQLKRGSSLFFRYYTGPQVIVGGRVIAANTGMLKSPFNK